MLKVEAINTFYGSSHILHDVSLEVHPGEIVVLLGRNGVGKTTTLKSIMGILPLQNGRVVFEGERDYRIPPHKVAACGVAFIPEERRIFPNLTVLENLKMGMVAQGNRIDSRAQLAVVLDYFPRLRERINNKGNRLSGGEQQMLTIARGLVSNPKLLMIDEPTEGLSPILVAEITRIIRRLHTDGVTILVVEQNYEMSLNLSENLRAYVIEKGQIKLEGTKAKLRECQADVEKCLGVENLAYWFRAYVRGSLVYPNRQSQEEGLMEKSPVVKYDEKGVMDGGTMGLRREMNRDIWLKEVFPEWGSYLNYEIDQFKVPSGAGALWYFGAMSCAIKTQAGAVFTVDLYSGPSIFHRSFLLRRLQNQRRRKALLDAYASNGDRPMEVQTA